MSLKKKLLIVLIVAVVGGAGIGMSLWLDRADLNVGGKDFTEQSVLCEMIAIMVEEHTDLTVRRRPYLGGTMVCFNALKAGDLDCYAEYTGTGLVSILKQEGISDPQKAYEKVQAEFATRYKLTWLKPFGFNNTYTLTMRKAQAKALGIKTVSDLAAYIRKQKASAAGPALVGGFTAEFLDRPDGYKGLTEAYGFTFAAEPKQMDPGAMYKACADGAVDVICAFATDGRIAAYDLQTLQDDKTFFPPYYAAPLIREETLAKHPQLGEVLDRLAGKLNDETMQRLNLEVDEKHRRPAQVAREFLVAEGLIPS